MRRTLLLCTALMIIIVTGCSTVDQGPTASPAPGSTDPSPSTSPSPSTPGAGTPDPSDAAGALTIVFNDGNGASSSWTLTCDPAGGTHPDPAAACTALDTNGATALPAVPKDRMCTEIYGGPQTATITGTWRGETVNSSLKRNNGCEIARWTALEGLLPTANS